MKDYQKPEFEVITLIAKEPITNNGAVGGVVGNQSTDPDLDW